MNTSRFLKLFFITYPLFVVADFTLFSFLMEPIYKANLTHLMHMEMNWKMLLISLLALGLVVVGALVFLLPKVRQVSYTVSFCWGALYGLVIYGVYSLSNYALLKAWPLYITLIDCAWGMFMIGILALFLTFLSRKKLD